MGGSRPSIAKHQRERAKAERRREKADRMANRKHERAPRPEAPDGGDPDLAGIVLGPQPLPWDIDADEAAESDDDSDKLANSDQG